MVILVITNRKDITSDFLINELTKRGVPFRRLNTEQIADYKTVIDPLFNRFEINGPSGFTNFDDVSAAYFRRPGLPELNHFGRDYRDYRLAEWNAFLRSLYSTLGDRWFSHPIDIVTAEDKPRQLKIAVQIGFNVPASIITNDISEVQKAFSKYKLVAKPLNRAILEVDGTEHVVFTSEMESLTEADRLSISTTPVIFQRFVDKVLDVRVTVVGKRVFPVAIHSQTTKETRIDWRRGANPNLRHEVIGISEEIQEKCIRIVEAQNLRFGAIDLVRDQNGEFWFLECNPNGQWAWIENRTGLPIAAAIVDELVALARLR